MKNLFLILVLFLFIDIHAQEISQVPSQIADFYSYEGIWDGIAKISMNGHTEEGTFTHDWSKISGGWGMLIGEVIDIPLWGTTYIGHNVLGYDLGEKKYHMFTVDNYANVHDHDGIIEKPGTIYFEYNGLTSDGKSYKEEVFFYMTGNDEYVIDVETKINGITEMQLELKASKRK